VRLAQDFSLRYPLIDGQGNFGNIDGDNAAAMRYTEARLTVYARALLEGIDEDAVDFRPTYDGEAEEPVVLPGAFPNLLANGAQGIAVGMATAIPPHNAGEICNALLHLVKKPGCGVAQLLKHLPGPDLPTGGVLVESRETLLQAYETGRGSLRVRARWEVERLKGGGYQVVVREIPYHVAKSRLVEKIAELLNGRKLAFLEDVRDESTEEVRLVLEPKSRNVDPQVLMESLFRQTDLESRITLNMNVLDKDHTPRVMSLAEVLRAFLDHRHEVKVRRTRYRLEKIATRLEVLEGYLVVFLNLDEVIRIIREEDNPKGELIATFDLSEAQAEAILNMRLRNLRKLEEEGLRKEHAALTKEQRALKGLLKDQAKPLEKGGKLWQAVAEEIKALREALAGDGDIDRRRTEIAEAPSDVVVPLEAVVEREPVTVLCSAKGWVRALKGHQEDTTEARHKEGDRGRFALHAQTTDKLLVFATNGRVYTLGVDKLPGGRGYGEPIRLSIDLPNDQDVVTLRVHRPGQRLLVASSEGRGFVVQEDEVVAQTRNGKQVLNVGGDVEAVACVPVEGDMVAVIGENRKLLIFPLKEIPEMTRGRGVILQRYRDGGLADIQVFDHQGGLSWSMGAGRRRSETAIRDWLGKRGAAGRLPPKGFPRSGRFD
jgi:topoisomerase-4 subunit A